MGSNGFDQIMSNVEEEEGFRCHKVDDGFGDDFRSSSLDAGVESISRDELVVTDSLDGGTNYLGPTSVMERFQSDGVSVGLSPPRKSLNHCITAPAGTHINQVTARLDTTTLLRSMSAKDIPAPWHGLKSDKMSEREKKKLIANLVRIQNDGTVQVDIGESAPVASEFLEPHAIDKATIDLDVTVTGIKKPIPRLKIAVLVVGTRGDVQPFLAMAKRLQEFGHHVRFATHVNFRSFVKSSGVEFYPLGGDPRILAG